ncbi:MAG: hypothetical protein WCP24_00600 [bacterium]
MEFKENTFFDQLGLPPEKDDSTSDNNHNFTESPSSRVETASASPRRRETKADRLARLKAEKLEIYRQYLERNKID